MPHALKQAHPTNASKLGKYRPAPPVHRMTQLRRWGTAWEQRAPRPGEQVVVAVDATGMSITRVGGWAMDKPNSTDHRRGKYNKLHTVVDSATGEILAWELTGAKGAGSGDCTVGPHLLNGAGWDVRAVCGDGAYGTAAMFAASARLHAKLLTPLPSNAVYNTCAARNELLTQQSRIGRKVWKSRSGYHARSPVEAVYATTGRQGGGNRLRNRTPATKDVEMALKVALHNMTRVARMAVAG